MTWTAQEDLLLQVAVRHLGSNWTVIAGVLPGRTEDGLRNRWYRLQKQSANPCVLLLLNKLFNVAPIGTAVSCPSAQSTPEAAPRLPTVYGVPCTPVAAPAPYKSLFGADADPVDDSSAPAAQKRKLEGDAAADAARDELALLRRQVASLKAENQSLRGAQPPTPPVAAAVEPLAPVLGAGGWGWGDDDDSSEETLLRQLAESLQDEDLTQILGKGRRSSSVISLVDIDGGTGRRSSALISLQEVLDINDGKGRRSSVSIRRSSSVSIRRSSSVSIRRSSSVSIRRSA